MLSAEMTKKLASVWILLLLTSGCRHRVLLPENTKENYKSFVNVVDETSGKNRLVVYLFGSPPLLLKKDVIKINGFILAVHRLGHEDAVYVDGGGEIDPNIIVDYTGFEKGVIRITTCAWDPRRPYEDDVPFVEKSVNIEPGGQVETFRRLLLQPEKASKDRIDSLFAEILAESKKEHRDPAHYDEAAETVNRNLAHLRNISLNNPDEILKRMKSLPHLAGDCVCQHMKNGYIEEVEAVKEILRQKDHLTKGSSVRGEPRR